MVFLATNRLTYKSCMSMLWKISLVAASGLHPVYKYHFVIFSIVQTHPVICRDDKITKQKASS